MIALVRQCVRFRELVAALMGRELRARYRGSALGSFWLVIQPLIFLLIYYLVFSQIFEQSLGNAVPKSLFALAMFCGLIPWIAFSETVSRGTGCVAENGNLIKKIAFPSELLPVYLTGVSLINSLIGFVMLTLFAFFLLDGQLPRMIWLFPIVLFLQGVFTLGIVYMVSSVTVYVRDIAQMVPMLLTFGFFLSPIFMFAKNPKTPELLKVVLRYNPITYMIAIYREIFIWTPEDMSSLGVTEAMKGKKETVALPFTLPGDVPWTELGIFACCAFVSLFIGVRVFKKLKPGFADEV